MTTRSKTLVFIQFRNTFARNASRNKNKNKAFNNGRGGGFGLDHSESAGLIENELDGEVAVEMSALPPKWVDVVDEVDDEIEEIKAKIVELEALHKKHLLPGFADKVGDEQSIERTTNLITNMFRSCQAKIKRIERDSQKSADEGSKQTAQLGRNIQVSLASKLQEVSGTFRKSQSSYLTKLRGRETRSKDMFQTGSNDLLEQEEDELDAVFTDAQMAAVMNNERAISERESQINDIVKSINGLAEIFKELQSMVIDQGTVLDRIDYNIEQVNVHMENAHGQLVQGSKYQSKTKAKLVIIFLALLVFILVVILFYKIIKRK